MTLRFPRSSLSSVKKDIVRKDEVQRTAPKKIKPSPPEVVTIHPILTRWLSIEKSNGIMKVGRVMKPAVSG